MMSRGKVPSIDRPGSVVCGEPDDRPESFRGEDVLVRVDSEGLSKGVNSLGLTRCDHNPFVEQSPAPA